MQIRIYKDGTFESLSAAVKTELATLKEDLKTITKVEGLRVKREAAKKAGNALKDKAFLAEIKKLKATLSSNRNSSVAIVREKIAKLSKATTVPKEQLAARQRKAVHAPKKPTYAPSTVTKTRKAVESKQSDTLGLTGLSAKEKATAKKYLKMNTHDILRATEGGKPADSRLAGRVIAGQLSPEDRDTVRAALSKHQNRVTRNLQRTKPDGGKADRAAAAELMKSLNKGDKLHGIIGDPRKAFELAAGIVEGDNHMRAAAKKSS